MRVTFESFLAFVTHHSESIIQWVLLALLLLAALLAAMALMSKKEEHAPAGPTLSPSPDLQAMLDKVLAQTAKLENVSLQGMSASGVAEVETQLQALKKDLASREEEINKLKDAGSAKTSDEAAQLNNRIKELEAKLAEYEILEDDIADLSLYKEENARLKAELEKVRSSGPVEPKTAERPAESIPDESLQVVAPPSGEAIVAEFAQAVSTDPIPAANAVAADLDIPDTGNPMADFESTVQLERKLAGASSAAPATPPPSPSAPAVAAVASKPAPAAAPAASPVAPAAQAEADDLFAEFSQPQAPDSLESSTLDTDKMMEEMAALVSMEPSNGNSLDEGIDMDKMAVEAGKKA